VDKLWIIWLGTRQQFDKVTVQMLKLQNATVPFSSVVNDLGVLLDGQSHCCTQPILLLPLATAKGDQAVTDV